MGLLAVMALAAGIGSATAIYTVVNAVLLRPVPWPHGERFVALFSSTRNASSKWQWSSTSWLDLLEYQRRSHSFDAFGIYSTREFVLTSPGEPRHLQGVEVSPAFAAAVGVAPVVGRWFGEAASESGNAGLAVISSALWRRLGSDPSIVGRALTMDGRPYTVTGIMPDGFRLPLAYVEGSDFDADVWVPLNPQGGQRVRNYAGYFCYARLRPGVSLAQANDDVKRVAAQLAAEFPDEHRNYTALVVSLVDSIVKEIRPALLLLFAAAGALLAITCANVAGLLLARSVARARETAIRVALGGAGWQLASQYFVEGLLVAVAGGALGIAISVGLVRLVLSVAAGLLPRSSEVGLNGMVVLFAFAAVIACSMLVCLAPLWQAVRIQPNEALGEGVRASAPARSRRLSRSLVVAEIALAFTLLCVGAVLIAHLNRLLRTAPGFDPNGLLTFTLNTSAAEYPDAEHLAAYQQRLQRAIAQIPGVAGAGLVDHLPLEGCCYVTSLFPAGSVASESGVHEVNLIAATPGYFHTMRIPLLRGRYLDERDNGKGDILDIVIDEAAARQYWPGRDALGADARMGAPNGTRVRIAGIVGSVRNRGLADETEAEVYIPAGILRVDPMHFVVRSRLPAATLIPEIRQAIRNVNPAQPFYDARPMREIVLGSVVTERLQSLLTTFFATAALLMAALGVYGVVSYGVRHRTVEIGTRMALGATGGDVLRLVLGDGLKMAGYGIVIGAVAVAAVVFLLQSRTFGMRMDDPWPFLYATAILAGVSALACLFPAWRATLVSPMVAIRDDPGSLWQSARLQARNIARRASELVYGSAEDEAAQVTFLAALIDASRDAKSFREAIGCAIEALRAAIRAESAWVLELPDKEAPVYRLAASAPADFAPGCEVPARGALTGRLRGYPFPLVLSESDLDAWSRWAASEKPEHLAEIACLRSTGAALAVPVLAKDDIAGILLLGRPAGRGDYTAAEKRALRNCAAQFALMMENARLTERMLRQEKINRDVQLAAEVQKRLFPDKPPASAAVTLAGSSLPARSVGGDYYDFFDLGDGRIGIALADVAGKGVAAALIMSVVQASLRVLASEDNASLATIAAKMNRFLHRSTGSNAYATFFYGEIDERQRRLRYVNAGHNPPCLLRCAADRVSNEQAQNGPPRAAGNRGDPVLHGGAGDAPLCAIEEQAQNGPPRAAGNRGDPVLHGGAGDAPLCVIEELAAGGTVIGLFPQSTYEESAVDLHPGDVLIAFTDGVPEALNPQDEEFGEDRLKDLLRRVAGLEVSEMASRIASEMKAWIDTADQYDDLTYILVKVNP